MYRERIEKFQQEQEDLELLEDALDSWTTKLWPNMAF